MKTVKGQPTGAPRCRTNQSYEITFQAGQSSTTKLMSKQSFFRSKLSNDSILRKGLSELNGFVCELATCLNSAEIWSHCYWLSPGLNVELFPI